MQERRREKKERKAWGSSGKASYLSSSAAWSLVPSVLSSWSWPIAFAFSRVTSQSRYSSSDSAWKIHCLKEEVEEKPWAGPRGSWVAGSISLFGIRLNLEAKPPVCFLPRTCANDARADIVGNYHAPESLRRRRRKKREEEEEGWVGGLGKQGLSRSRSTLFLSWRLCTKAFGGSGWNSADPSG